MTPDLTLMEKSLNWKIRILEKMVILSLLVTLFSQVSFSRLSSGIRLRSKYIFSKNGRPMPFGRRVSLFRDKLTLRKMVAACLWVAVCRPVVLLRGKKYMHNQNFENGCCVSFITKAAAWIYADFDFCILFYFYVMPFLYLYTQITSIKAWYNHENDSSRFLISNIFYHFFVLGESPKPRKVFFFRFFFQKVVERVFLNISWRHWF